MRASIDTNIIIDLLADREPFSDDGALLFEHIATGKLHANISANCLANVYLRGLETGPKFVGEVEPLQER
jgi:predicted nucleic acid-binding protein